MTETRSGARPVVVIRADASIQIGAGHVMRGLTLVDALRRMGAAVRLIGTVDLNQEG